VKMYASTEVGIGLENFSIVPWDNRIFTMLADSHCLGYRKWILTQTRKIILVETEL
jgi:hypothetical protein